MIAFFLQEIQTALLEKNSKRMCKILSLPRCQVWLNECKLLGCFKLNNVTYFLTIDVNFVDYFTITEFRLFL